MRSPQTKKALSYAYDNRNAYGESNKTSRTAIPARKSGESRRSRRKAVQGLAISNQLDEEQSDILESSLRHNVERVGGWRKKNDIPLAKFYPATESQAFKVRKLPDWARVGRRIVEELWAILHRRWTPMTEPISVYLYRSKSSGTKRESCTVLCAAPADLVVAVYGGGGHHDEEGVNQAFGGHLLYRDDEIGQTFIGIWGSRYASRFRTALRRRRSISIVRQPPPARLVWSETMKQRPPTSKQYGID